MNEQFEDLLAVYVLGGLTPEEEAEVEAYVAANPEAAARLKEAQGAADLLPLAAEPREPSAAVETALFNRIERKAEAAKLTAEERVVSVRAASQQTSSFWDSLLALFRSPMVTAVSLGAAVLIFLWALSLNAQVRDLNQNVSQLAADNGALNTEVAALADENGELNGRIAALEAANQGLDSEIKDLAQFNAELVATNSDLQNEAALSAATISELERNNATLSEELAGALASFPFNSPDIFSVTLPGTEAQPEASAQLVVDPVTNSALLVVAGMPELPENAVYQVLLIRGTEHETAETFRVDTEGDGVLLVQSSEPLASFDAVGVSIEPEGGSVQRTGEIVLLGNLIN